MKRRIIAPLLIVIALMSAHAQTAEASTPTVAEAKAYALRKLGKRQFACLSAIATRESHWNPHARNRSSGAYGIGQALPASKMHRFGADYLDNPVTQVRWMLAYVHSRYGTACIALDHSYRTGWY